MRRLAIFLLGLCIAALFAFPAAAVGTLDTAAITADVAENGEASVSMSLTVTGDGGNTLEIPLTEGSLSHIEVENLSFDVEEDADGGKTLLLRSKNGFLATQTIRLRYTDDLTKSLADDGEAQEVTLNLLPSAWGSAVSSFTFQVTMPKDTGVAPEVISGYYGTLSEEESGLQANGLTASGTVKDLMAYETISLHYTLPAGYFTVRSISLTGIQFTRTAAVMLLLLAAGLIYWFLTLRTKTLLPKRRLRLPEGVPSWRLTTALDGETIDFAALILDWASSHYIAVLVSRSGSVSLRCTMAMGSERTRSEQKLFQAIFRRKTQVRLYPGRYATAGEAFARREQRAFSRTMISRRSGNPAFLRLLSALLAALGVLMMLLELLPDAGGFVLLAGLGAVGALLLAGIVSDVIRNARILRRQRLPHFIAVLAVLILAAFAFLYAKSLACVIGCLSLLLLSALSARGPQRSERGCEALSQTEGLRQAQRSITFAALRHRMQRNPQFFSQQLPSAAALETGKALSQRMERLRAPVPYWLYTGRRTGTGNASDLWKQIQPVCQEIRKAFR